MLVLLCSLFTLVGGDLSYAVWTPRGGSQLAVETAKTTYGIEWWVESDERLLVFGDQDALDHLGRIGHIQRLDVSPRPDLVFLVALDQSLTHLGPFVELIRGGRLAIVQFWEPPRPKQQEQLGCHHFLARLDQSLVLQKAPMVVPPLKACSTVQQLVDQVDSARWYGDIQTLATFNRHTHNAGNLAARDWLVAQFEAIDNLTVWTEPFMVGSTTTYNVFARLDGSTRPDDWYIVGAHYDSTSESTSTAAPGAEDNASGTAALIEMARIMAQTEPQATVFFIAYSGEEQGLHGSEDHASKLVSGGDDDKIQVALIMDMIGYTADADLDCLLETTSSNQFIVDDLSAAAASYTSLRIVTSFFPFGSDHMPYLNRGMPSLLTIENDWNIYPEYHSTGDLPGQIDQAMGGEVIRMNLATLAKWTDAVNCLSFPDLVSLWPLDAPTGTDTNGNGVIDVQDLVTQITD